MSNLSPDSIDEKGVRHFRSQAKLLKKRIGCKSTTALDKVAQEHSFKNWNNVLRFAEINEKRHRPSQSRETIMDKNLSTFDINEKDRTLTEGPFEYKLPLIIEAGRCKIKLRELGNIKKGTLLELNTSFKEDIPIYIGNSVIAGGAREIIDDKFCVRVEKVGYFTPSKISSFEEGELSTVLSVEVGRATISVNEVLQLHQGSTICLSKHHKDPLDLMIGNQLVGGGDIVTLGNKYGVHILQFTPPQ